MVYLSTGMLHLLTEYVSIQVRIGTYEFDHLMSSKCAWLVEAHNEDDRIAISVETAGEHAKHGRNLVSVGKTASLLSSQELPKDRVAPQYHQWLNGALYGTFFSNTVSMGMLRKLTCEHFSL